MRGGVIFDNSIKGGNRDVVYSPGAIDSASCLIVRSACKGHLRKNRQGSAMGSLTGCLRGTFSGNKGMVVPSFTIKEARRVLCTVHRVGRGKLIGKRGNFPMCMSDPLTDRTASVFVRYGPMYFSRRALGLMGRNGGPL